MRLSLLLAFLLLAASPACSSGGTERAGQPCQVTADCYKGLKTPPRGDVVCLTRVTGGYCTHLCTADTECCAVEGECRTDLPQVCAPFESTNQQLCFLSCGASVLGGKDGSSYCDQNAHQAFICRSTGGGAQNKQVCTP